MTWYRRSKLGFDAISRPKIIASKAPNRNPASTINNNNNQLSEFTSSSKHPPISSFSSNWSSHFRFSSSRCYHVDRQQVIRHSNSKARNRLYQIALELGIRYYHVETIPYTNRKHRLLISHDQERTLGERLFEEMKAESKGKILAEMSPESVQVNMILKRIIEALDRGLKNSEPECGRMHLEGLKWEVVVKKDDYVWAGCVPAGKMVVFTGLLEVFRTDEEIATIIAHEVAHVVARHETEKDAKMRWFTTLMLMLSQFVVVDPNAVKKLYDLLSAPFSRRMELEADYIGMLLMASAGYDPRVAPKTYVKLDQASSYPLLGDYFATHPSGKRRSKLLSESSVMQEAISIYQEAIAGQEVDT